MNPPKVQKRKQDGNIPAAELINHLKGQGHRGGLTEDACKIITGKSLGLSREGTTVVPSTGKIYERAMNRVTRGHR